MAIRIYDIQGAGFDLINPVDAFFPEIGSNEVRIQFGIQRTIQHQTALLVPWKRKFHARGRTIPQTHRQRRRCCGLGGKMAQRRPHVRQQGRPGKAQTHREVPERAETVQHAHMVARFLKSRERCIKEVG